MAHSAILSDYGSTVPLLGIYRNLQFHSAWRNFFQVQSEPLQEIFGIETKLEVRVTVLLETFDI